jgi:hypothetical protein
MVCAWCSTLVSRRAPPPGFERNYGMCRQCVEEQLARLAPRTRRRPRPTARGARNRLPAPAEHSYDPACSKEGLSARSL